MGVGLELRTLDSEVAKARLDVKAISIAAIDSKTKTLRPLDNASAISY